MEKTILSMLLNFLVTQPLPQMPLKQEWHKSEAIEYFGPEVSEKSACMAAENKAVLNVIRKVSGESVSASQFQMCNEVGEDVCQILMLSSTHTEGMVTGVRKLSSEASGSGIRSCKVDLEVSITKDNGKSDVGFDPEIRMTKTQLRHNEKFKIVVTPTQPTHINLFYFSPYLEPHEQVRWFHVEDQIDYKKEIPDFESFWVTFPPVKVNGNIAGEVMIVVATKKPISFRKVFSLAEFNQRIQEIPKSERRVVKIPYFIWAKDNTNKFK